MVDVSLPGIGGEPGGRRPDGERDAADARRLDMFDYRRRQASRCSLVYHVDALASSTACSSGPQVHDCISARACVVCTYVECCKALCTCPCVVEHGRLRVPVKWR